MPGPPVLNDLGRVARPERTDLVLRERHMSQRATVLVVDDDPDTVSTLREILEEEGHVVLSARNGREGLQVALQTIPDLVLLDLNMPEMDGRAFLEAFKKSPTLAQVAVVVLSGAADAPRL